MSNSNKTKLLAFGKTASKGIEIICWVGVACLLLVTLCGTFNSNWASQNLMPETGITMNGVSIAVGDGAGETSYAAVIVVLLGACIGLAVEALLFRNLFNVLKTAEGGSPFQLANVKRIERIGYLSIAMPVIAFLITTIAKLVGGPDALEISLDLTGIIMGVLVLILSQFFAHGVELEQDVDGLV